MRTIALALLLPLLASASLAAAPEPQEVRLQFMPQPGDKMRQMINMDMRMTMNLLPGPDMTDEQRAKMLEAAKKVGKGMAMDMKMTLRSEASEVDAKGDYLLHLRGEGGQFKLTVAGQPPKDMPNPMGDMELDALTNTAKPDLQILRVKSAMPGLSDPKMLDGLAQGVIKQAFGAMSGLEGRRMKVGESVEIPFDLQMPMAQLPGQSNVKTTVVYTLKSIRQGIATFDTKAKMSMAMVVNEGQPQNINMTMDGSGTGKMAYRIADRLPIHSDMNLLMHMDMQLPGGASNRMDMGMKLLTRAERYR